ncbi:MAG: hypothetical protein COA78_21885 [Blastopirellula sp.]|nr:MAG: hypothetical protein COA78_21885 [Blastopirellula sp.]
MATSILSILSGDQVLDSNGDPISGARLYFFDVGTTTDKTVYTDAGLTAAHPQPVVADSAGRFGFGIYLASRYKIILKNASDVTIETIDDIDAGTFDANGKDVSLSTAVLHVLLISNLSSKIKADLTDGQIVDVAGGVIKGDAKGGNFYWDSGSTQTADGKIVIISDEGGNGRWIRINNIQYETLMMGDGIKGSPQNNVGFQIHRDITNEGTSSHGFNDASYYAEDTQAYNTFGSDINIGDGSQTAPFEINHVNSFQVTDLTDLGTAKIGQHLQYIAQSVLSSGTISRSVGLTIISELGLRDTPGFTDPNYQVNGPAAITTEVGITTAIRDHASISYSAHFTAGATDAGATLTSGGAPIRVECPITSTQTTSSTSQTTGAQTLMGGLGVLENIHAGGEINVNNASASYKMNSAAGTALAAVVSTSTLTTLKNIFSGTLEFGVSDTNVLRLLSDRFMPTVDNVTNLGDSSHRWSTVFAGTGTINTSDETQKTQIKAVDDKLLDAWGDVETVIFKFKNAVDKKGKKARKHIGHIAQQVESCLNKHGINGYEYGLLCKDPVFETVKKIRKIKVDKTEVIKTKVEKLSMVDGKLVISSEIKKEICPVVERCVLHNPDGSVYLDNGVEQVRDYILQIEIDEEYTEEVQTDNFLMGLRYDHCNLVSIAYLRREIDNLKGLK